MCKKHIYKNKAHNENDNHVTNNISKIIVNVFIYIDKYII